MARMASRALPQSLFVISLLAACLGVSSAFFVAHHPPVAVPLQQRQLQRQRQPQQRQNNGLTSLYAKKKKKGGGNKNKQKKQQQKSGFEWATSFVLKPFESKVTRELASAACSSFQAYTGKPLCDEVSASADVPKSLWNALNTACVIVSGYPQENDDNDDGVDDNENESSSEERKLVVRYANVAALETVGLKADAFERFVAMPDANGNLQVPSLDKNPVVIDLPMEFKGDKKYQGGYEKKILRAGDNNDVTIVNAHRWSIEKSTIVSGKFVTETVGVAYAWKEWLLGESTVCRPGGFQDVKIDIGALEEQIKAQGAFIRELKEVQGFGNKDPEVMDAVDELLRLKATLEEAQA